MNKNKNYIFYKDLSLFLLIISNAIIITLAIMQKWDYLIVIWTYLIQSVIIGFLTIFKILNLKKFSTEGFYIKNKQAEVNDFTKYKAATFFLNSYLFFHAIYIIFLLVITINTKDTNLTKVLITAIGASIIFLVNHLFSYNYNKQINEKKLENINNLIFRSYSRIIPMHIIILIGFSFINKTNTIILFMILKTFLDVLMHINEHSNGIIKTYQNYSAKNEKISPVIRFLIKVKTKHFS